MSEEQKNRTNDRSRTKPAIYGKDAALKSQDQREQMRMTIEPPPSDALHENNQVQDGFSSTAGGQGVTFDNQTKIDLKSKGGELLLMSASETCMTKFVNSHDGNEASRSQ